MADTKIVDGVEVPLSQDEQAELDERRNAPLPVPAVITVRQFWHALVKANRVTTAQAIAAVKTGTYPAFLTAYLDTIVDAGGRFDAEMQFCGQGILRRNGIYITGLQAHHSLTDAQIDAVFRFAGNL